MFLITILYAFVIACLALYGIHWLWMTVLGIVYSNQTHPQQLPVLADGDLPTVTVLLAMYNEESVAARIIDAVCAFDYPSDRLQVLVLDDSTDGTAQLVAARTTHWQQQGHRIEHVVCPRLSYADKTNVGLERASGEFVAIFDADFVPAPDWLRRVVVHFYADGSERLGLVQTRWGHLNADHSALTRAQQLIIDMYFSQQLVHDRQNLLHRHFTSAVLGRLVCINEVGRWQAKTQAPDLEITMRIQLAGWKIGYDHTIVTPAELVPQMLAYKKQQFRWFKGMTQGLRLFSGPLWRSELSPWQQLERQFTMTHHLIPALMIALLLLRLPLLLWPTSFVTQLDIVMLVAQLGIGLPSILSWLRYRGLLPWDMVVQIGLGLNYTCAALTGFFGPFEGNFEPTPKIGQGNAVQVEGAVTKSFTLDGMTIGELVLFVIAVWSFLLAIQQQQWFALPFLLTCSIGFGWVGLASLWEHIQQSRVGRPHETEVALGD